MLKKKMAVMLWLLVALMSVSAWADLAIDFVVKDVPVKAKRTTIGIDIMVKSDTYDLQGLNLKFTAVAGVTPLYDKAVFNSSLLCDMSAAPTNQACSAVGANWLVKHVPVTTGPGLAKDATTMGSDYKKFATVYVKLDDNLGGKVSIPVSLTTAYLWTGSAATPAKIGAASPKAVTMPDEIVLDIQSNFNFNNIADYTMEEDCQITINPADESHFECTSWVEATQDLGKSTGKFASVEQVTPTEAGEAILQKDGTILFIADKDYNGDVTIDYTAISDDASLTDVATGSVNIVITPVNDPPAVLGINYYPNEFEEGTSSMDIELWIEDPDSNDFTYTLQGKLPSGVVTLASGSFTGTHFTQNGISIDIPFDFVAHPDMQSSIDMTLVVSDGIDSTTFDLGDSSGIVVHDVDQIPAIEGKATSVGGLNHVTTDDLVVDVSGITVTDADEGDDASAALEYKWENGVTDLNVNAPVLPASMTSKNETYTCSVFAYDIPYGNNDKVYTNTNEKGLPAPAFTFDFKVINSAPTITGPESLFIQKPKDGSAPAPKVFYITFDDPDWEADSIEVDVTFNTPAKGTLAGVGWEDKVITMSYTVTDKDTEFYGESADKFTITVKDTDNLTASLDISVAYREDPAPVLVSAVDPVETAAEVDEDGNPTVISASITAADSDTSTTPSGVQAITWTLTKLSGDTETEIALPDDAFAPIAPTAGTDEATSTCSFELGYDVIQGAARSQEIKLKLAASASDGNGSTEELKSWEITVTDVDRAPEKPQSLTVYVNGVETDDIKSGDLISAKSAPENFVDLDGDAVLCSYTLYVDGHDEVSVSLTPMDVDMDLPYNEKKGNVIKVDVVGISAPAYDDTAKLVSEALVSDEYVVGNTAPTVIAKGTVSFAETHDGQPLADTFRISLAGMGDGSEVAEVTDVDVNYGLDSLVYAVSYNEEISKYISDITIEVDADGATLAITPVPFANTEDAATLPAFTLYVTDEDGESAFADINVEITPVNNVPEFLSPATIPVLPAQLEALELTAEILVNVGGYGYENKQTIPVANVTVSDITESDASAPILSAVDVLSSEATENAGEYKVSVKISLDADAAERMANYATFKMTVKDDGAADAGDELVGNTADMTFKVVLNPAPWFPFFDLSCTHMEDGSDVSDTTTHKITIADPDGKVVATLQLTGRNVFPADYFGKTNGLLPGTVYTVTARAMNSTEDCVLAVDTIETTYGEPEMPKVNTTEGKTAEDTYEIDGNIFSLDFDIPMASRYLITDTDVDGNVYKTNGVFQPDYEDGLVISSAIEELKLAAAGEHIITIQGFNPQYTADTQVKTISVTVSQEVPLEACWDYSKFQPETGSSQLDGDVIFNWSDYLGASSYTMYLMDSQYKVVRKVTTAEPTLSLQGLEAGNYSWYVVADNAPKDPSMVLTFNILDVTSTQPLVEGVYCTENALEFVCFSSAEQDLDPSAISIRVYYYTDEKGWFYNGPTAPVLSTSGDYYLMDLDFAGVANKPTFTPGNIILVEFYKNGVLQNNIPAVFQMMAGSTPTSTSEPR